VETARAHLDALVEEGRLIKKAGLSRGYRLPDFLGKPPSRTHMVPLLGRVQAGELTTAVEDLEGYVPVKSRHPGDELFALRVRGESMTGAGILPGDVVIVKKQPSAQSDEIVVALIDDEATVKRLKVNGKQIELHPENPKYEILVPPPEELNLLGKVIEVRRYLGATELTFVT
jgi:repressor LexA